MGIRDIEGKRQVSLEIMGELPIEAERAVWEQVCANGAIMS